MIINAKQDAPCIFYTPTSFKTVALLHVHDIAAPDGTHNNAQGREPGQTVSPIHTQPRPAQDKGQRVAGY